MAVPYSFEANRLIWKTVTEAKKEKRDMKAVYLWLSSEIGRNPSAIMFHFRNIKMNPSKYGIKPSKPTAHHVEEEFEEEFEESSIVGFEILERMKKIITDRNEWKRKYQELERQLVQFANEIKQMEA